MINDIDFSGVTLTSDNERCAVFEKYYGTIDGNGYALKNLRFENGVRSLFGEFGQGKLINTHFQGVVFDGKMLTDERRAFLCGIVGELTFGAKIEHCSFQATFLAVGDEETIKIHFHTNEPWLVLQYCATLGEIYDIVVEDMERQSRGLNG